MTYSSIIVPKVAEGFVSHQHALGVNSYDLDELYSPDTDLWKSKVLDLASPKYNTNASYIFDKSRYQNHGTITGATWAQTSQGLWYLDFDGNNQKSNHGTGASLNINYPLTLICWFRVTNTANRQWLMSKADPVSALLSHCNYGLQVYNNRVWGLAGDGTNSNEATNTTAFSTDTWTFAAYSLSGTKVPTIVVNGVAQTTTQIGFEPAKDAYALWTGASSGNYWDVTGGIALARVLNRALSSSELEGIRNQEQHLFGA